MPQAIRSAADRVSTKYAVDKRCSDSDPPEIPRGGWKSFDCERLTRTRSVLNTARTGHDQVGGQADEQAVLDDAGARPQRGSQPGLSLMGPKGQSRIMLPESVTN